MDGQLAQSMRREVQLANERDEQKLQEERNKMKTLTEVWQEQSASLKHHEDEVHWPDSFVLSKIHAILVHLFTLVTNYDFIVAFKIFFYILVCFFIVIFHGFVRVFFFAFFSAQIKVLQQQERECLIQLNKLADMEDQRKKLEDKEQRKELG